MRTLGWLCAFVVVGSCGHDDKPSTPPPANVPATPADEEPAPAEPAAEGPGLAAKVDDAVGRARAAKSTLLVPNGVTVMAGVDIPPFIAKPYWRTIKDQLGSRPRRQLEAAERCKVGPDKWRSFVIGVQPTSRDMAMVVEAVGVGKLETLQCLQREFGRFTLSDDGKEMSDATGGGIVLDENRIAFATPALMQPLRDRIANEGQPAADAAMEAVLAKTDLKQPLWFAAIIPPTEAAVAAAMLGGWPSDVSGELDLADGMALHGRLTTTDPHSAKTKLEGMWKSVVEVARARGIPEAITDSVKLSAGDGVMLFDANASDDDIAKALDRSVPTGVPPTVGF